MDNQSVTLGNDGPESTSSDGLSAAAIEPNGQGGLAVAAQRKKVSWAKRLYLGYRNVLPNGTATLGFIMLVIIVVGAVFTPFLAPYDPIEQHIVDAFKPPIWMDGGSTQYVLGTDALGRDLFSRILFGLRTSLLVSISAVIVVLILGITVGIVAGYFGGLVDVILMRITDIQMAFPFIILAVAILAIVTPSPGILVLVLGMSTWPVYARVVRGMVMVEKQQDYIASAMAMGASSLRVIIQYMLRNFWMALLIFGTLDIATMIIGEALLGFLGIGIQPPTPSWGNIIADGKNYLTSSWWIATMPGFAILFTLLAFNLLGDGLQSRLDPKLRRM